MFPKYKRTYVKVYFTHLFLSLFPSCLIIIIFVLLKHVIEMPFTHQKCMDFNYILKMNWGTFIQPWNYHHDKGIQQVCVLTSRLHPTQTPPTSQLLAVIISCTFSSSRINLMYALLSGFFRQYWISDGPGNCMNC